MIIIINFNNNVLSLNLWYQEIKDQGGKITKCQELCIEIKKQWYVKKIIIIIKIKVSSH